MKNGGILSFIQQTRPRSELSRSRRTTQLHIRSDDKLADILCCPGCGGDVGNKYTPQRIFCLSCGESFGSSDNIFSMFRRSDLFDEQFLKYREAYEAHSRGDGVSSPSDVTQWSWLEMLASFMGNCDGRLVLDVGSADGKLGAVISGKTVCLDISHTCLKAAKEKGLTAVAGNAEALPFKRVFDTVVLSNVLEHVPNPERIIEEAKKVLKPSGLLYIIVPYKEDLSWYEGEDILDPHLTSFDFLRIKDLLGDFQILRHKFILFTTSRFLYSLKIHLRQLAPDLYNSLRRMKDLLKPLEHFNPLTQVPEAGGKRRFPKWRNALNYFPNAMVLPFMRPYLIIIEARLVE